MILWPVCHIVAALVSPGAGRISMDIPIQVDLRRIAQDLQIRRVQVESVVQLLDEGTRSPLSTRPTARNGPAT